MRITTKGHVAIRAALTLAKLCKKQGLVSINNICEEENVSPKFLEQIFFSLKKAGIVRSVRGPKGGFCFTTSPENLTVKEILLASGEELSAGNCEKHTGSCVREEFCKSHKIWVNLDEMVNNYLQGITLASLLKENPSNPKKE